MLHGEVTNLTTAVDGEALKRARVKALEESASANAMLRERLEEYAGVRPLACRRVLPGRRAASWRADRQAASSRPPGGHCSSPEGLEGCPGRHGGKLRSLHGGLSLRRKRPLPAF